MCGDIFKKSKTAIIVIGSYDKSDCSCNLNLINLPNGLLERQIPIYGITLIQDSIKNYNIKYLNPENINLELNKLIE